MDERQTKPSTVAKSVACVRRRDLLTTGYTTLANKAVEQSEESKEHGDLMFFTFHPMSSSHNFVTSRVQDKTNQKLDKEVLMYLVSSQTLQSTLENISKKIIDWSS